MFVNGSRKLLVNSLLHLNRMKGVGGGSDLVEHQMLDLKTYVDEVLRGKIIPLTTEKRVYLAIQSAIDRQNDKSLYGMKPILNELIDRYFRPAAKGYDVRKRLLVLVGPPGSGKSTLVQFIKDALSQYSHTEKGAVYRIKDCPLHENPLLALPHSIRQRIKKATGYHIEGELSSLNQYRLKHEWNEDWRNIPVERFYISESKRQGIGTFAPGDPHLQEVSELIGEMDYSTITTYGTPAHPKAYQYDGELQAGNQGIVELQEVFKVSAKLLFPLLSVAEEQMYKIPRQAAIHSDVVLIAHSNPEDLKKIVTTTENKPLLSRMIIQKVPYNLDLTEEIHLYASKLHQEDIERFQPFALDTLAATAIYTRVRSSEKYPLTKMEKVRLYARKEEPYESLREEFDDEGMNGLDPRMIFHVLSILAASHLQTITAQDLLHTLQQEINQDIRMGTTEKEHYRTAIRQGEKYFEERIKQFFIEQFAKLECERIHETIDLVIQGNMNDVDHQFKEFRENIRELQIGRIDFEQLPKEMKEKIVQASVKQFLQENGNILDWMERKLFPQLPKKYWEIKSNLEGIIEQLRYN